MESLFAKGHDPHYRTLDIYIYIYMVRRHGHSWILCDGGGASLETKIEE